ncbi:MAG: restriction endonuclease subunit S, partial [Desulfobacterales bacterium]|nr:restriction endonuclease subunit S [Desulfobacterales bacterium]
MKKGWDVKRLRECFKLKSGDNLTSKMMTENGKFPVYGGNGIAGMYDKFNLSGSNVIIGRVGALCGNVRHIKEEIWLTDNAFKITDWMYDFDHSFITYLLNFKNLRSYARQAAQPVISNSSLEDVLLQFPKSLHEQHRIVSILDTAFTAIDTAKANAEKNLKNAKEVFESYLNRVFAKRRVGWEEKHLCDVCSLITKGSSPKWQGIKYVDIPGILFITSENVGEGKLILDNRKYVEEKFNTKDKKSILQKGDVITNPTCDLLKLSQSSAKINQ